MNVYLSYCAICAAAMLIPGPDTFVVLRTSLAGGAGAGISAAAGSAFGNLLWAGGAALGLATLLTGAPVTLAVLKAAGAAYLLVLGTATLVAARNGTPLAGVSAGAGATAGRKAFRTGLVSDLANVKVGLFWIALLPQFVQPSAEPALASAMVLTMVV